MTSPTANFPNVDVSMAARQYVSAGWVLVPIAKGSKGPRHIGWNLRALCIDDEVTASKPRTGGVGLAHAYCNRPTGCIDLDDLASSRVWFDTNHGIDIDALLNAPDAVQILSGRDNRSKLLYRLPEGVEPLTTVRIAACGLELRCATREGKTVQDVLPPTIHPTTLLPYQWGGAGDWHNLPVLPPEILAVWQQLAAAVDPAGTPGGVADGDPNADPVVKHLTDAGWVKAVQQDGTRHILCPFEKDHTSAGSVGECSYFPALTGGFVNGHFHCLHAHCSERTDLEFLDGVKFDSYAAMKHEFLPIVHAAGDIEGSSRDTGWPNFPRDKTGKVAAIIEFVTKAVGCASMAEFCLAYDQFRDEIMLSVDDGANWRAFRDVDYTALRITLERKAFKPIGPEMARHAVARIAEDNQFDSAQQWLMSIKWDGVPRIDTFMPTYFDTEDNAYSRAVGLYAWTAMAGRVMEPGVKADMMPVLIGNQGIRKSSAVLAMAPHVDFFCEISFSEKEVETSRKMRGRLVGEIPELSGMAQRQIEHVKAFQSRRYEDWTPKFKEFNVQYARRIFFWGTTNQPEFLIDETGNRRFLPVTVRRAYLDLIVRDRDQLWAEGRDRFLVEGVCWQEAERLGTAAHAAHMITDVWEQTVRDWLDQLGADGKKNSTRDFLQAETVLRFALGFEPKAIGRREEMRIGKVLQSLGYERKQRQVGGRNTKVWVTSECLFNGSL